MQARRFFHRIDCHTWKRVRPVFVTDEKGQGIVKQTMPVIIVLRVRA
jgi:hypothetical protein